MKNVIKKIQWILHKFLLRLIVQSLSYKFIVIIVVEYTRTRKLKKLTSDPQFFYHDAIKSIALFRPEYKICFVMCSLHVCYTTPVIKRIKDVNINSRIITGHHVLFCSCHIRDLSFPVSGFRYYKAAENMMEYTNGDNNRFLHCESVWNVTNIFQGNLAINKPWSY